MININCTTATEAKIINDLIQTGLHNSRKEYLEKIIEMNGEKLNLNFTIEENKKKEVKDQIKRTIEMPGVKYEIVE